MRFDSTSAGHKVLIVALLLVLFSIPFIWQHALLSSDTQAVLSGGAVIGNAAGSNATAADATNNAALIGENSGKSFLGTAAQ